MNTPSGWIRRSLLATLMIGLLTAPEALAGGKRVGRPGGAARRPPRMSAAHRANRAPSYKAPQMSRPRSSARPNANLGRSNNVPSRANAVQARVNTVQPRVNGTASMAATAASLSPNTYRYGSGNNARNHQAYGYGRGYRNHYSAGRSGYGRSQGNNRAVVSRLRSVHKSLARLDHDYQGHRVQAMHHLSMTIRQLSHRSKMSGMNGSTTGQNNVLASGMNNRRAGANGLNGNAGANGRRTQHLSQAQSDTRMGQALRTTQGIAMQMGHQGTGSSGNARAQGHLHLAMRELNTALTVR